MAIATEPVSKALKEHENKLIECLEDADLVSLAGEAAKSELISGQVKTDLESLSPHVSHPLACRYLLYNVYNSFTEKVNAINTWLAILSKFVNEQVLSCVKNWSAWLMLSDSPLASQEMDMEFSKIHAEILTKMLAPYSHRWQEIGRSLYIYSIQIKAIQDMNLIDYDSLYRVIKLWLNRTCRGNSSSTTLKRLEKALCSARLETAAKELRGNHVLQALLNECKIVCTTKDKCVTTGSSILFEVHVQCTSFDSVAFEWQKDKQTLHKASEISNSHKSYHVGILCVHVIDSLAEGLYSCKVVHRRQVLVSPPIRLTVTTSERSEVLDHTDSKKEGVFMDSCENAKAIGAGGERTAKQLTDLVDPTTSELPSSTANPPTQSPSNMTRQLCRRDHCKIVQYLKLLQPDELITVAELLGLDYLHLKEMGEKEFASKVASAWLRRDDFVEKMAPPCWDNLAKAMGKAGFNGVASDIRNDMQ